MKSFQEIYDDHIRFQIIQTADWLNKFQLDGSAITPVTQPYLENASQTELPLDKVKGAIKTAVLLSQRFEMSLETPEVMLRGAVILFLRKDGKDARTLLEKAISLYEKPIQQKPDQKPGHPHRHAITCMVLALAELSLPDREAALFRWSAARESLQICLEISSRDSMRAYRDPLDEIVKWYNQRLAELEVEEVMLPEHVFVWMRRFSPVELTTSLALMCDHLFNEVANRNLRGVRKLVKTIVDLALKEDTTQAQAFACANASLALFMINDVDQAIVEIKRAVVLCNRRSHQQAVMTWLAGLLLWRSLLYRKDAVQTCQSAIQQFDDLAKEADHKDLQERKTWYLLRKKAIAAGAERILVLFLPYLIT